MQRVFFLTTGTLLSIILANNVNTGGLTGVNKTYSAYSLGLGSYELGLSLKAEYGQEALHEMNASGSNTLKDVTLLDHDLYMAVGLTNWMDAAIDLPFYKDRIDGFDKNGFGFGDLAAALKIMHPGMKPEALIRLAYIMRMSFPTGDPNKGFYARDPQYSHVSRINQDGAFTSQGYSLNPMLAWTFDLTHLKSPAPLLVHVNFGMDALIYASRDINIPQENTAMLGNLALEWLAQPGWSLFLDFYGKSRLINITVGPFLDLFNRDQLNLAVGTKNTFSSGWSLAFALEGSLSAQENFTRWSVNHDGNGVRTYGIQPTPIVGATLTLGFGKTGKNADSDFDGNPNSTDKCPNDPEDYDGYEDEDGCIDRIHVTMAPPTVYDTVLVTKRDTLTIVKNDTVRIAVADTLQFQTQQDPNQIFGFGKTTFPAINFKTGSDSLTLTSFKTLNDIAKSLQNFPTVSMEVVGYTDNIGGETTNKMLSRNRAESVVRYLVGKGVNPQRLQALGMGLTNPIGSNKTAAGRLLNRRVEFRRIK